MDMQKTGFARKWARLCLAVSIVALALLAIPEIRESFMALMNRIFAASEAANSYAYTYFPVGPEVSVRPAILALGAALAGLLGFAFLSGHRGCLLALSLAVTLVQIYFGLLLPWSLLLALYGVCALAQMARGARRQILGLLAPAALLVLLVCLVAPGVHDGLERTSERVRDLLTPMSGVQQGMQEAAGEEMLPVRPASERAILEGEERAQTGRTYSLRLIEEEKIASPEWLNLVRVILLLLLAAAAVVVPLLPFIALAFRGKTLSRLREGCSDADDNVAVTAMFRKACRTLACAELGCDNRLFRQWPESWVNDPQLEVYSAEFTSACRSFEAALYGKAPVGGEVRAKMAAFLTRTEKLVYAHAGRKERWKIWWKEGVRG